MFLAAIILPRVRCSHNEGANPLQLHHMMTRKHPGWEDMRSLAGPLQGWTMQKGYNINKGVYMAGGGPMKMLARMSCSARGGLPVRLAWLPSSVLCLTIDRDHVCVT
eukprot:TRINITY_DN6286_c0_g1_i1.p2 TRINITY_DN6286_c0_g1~~TRINITY_DN6286_c0_g1_i1.p2  ORF type:complete len:107 (-),score=7.87 TRINITY_DN6286_c0_g1_i1:23-343(-)